MKAVVTLLILTVSGLTTLGQVVDGGNGHAIILDKQGSVWTIGRNNYGQLGDSTLQNSPKHKKIKNLKDIVAISRGMTTALHLTKMAICFYGEEIIMDNLDVRPLMTN
ncbi:MAG: hypothetical protein M3R27_04375 [Bacteroidota bacterium]|nr:hypothetical protein [Bacteroidota bacterium]